MTEVFVKTKLKPAWQSCILFSPGAGITPFRREPKGVWTSRVKTIQSGLKLFQMVPEEKLHMKGVVLSSKGFEVASTEFQGCHFPWWNDVPVPCTNLFNPGCLKSNLFIGAHAIKSSKNQNCFRVAAKIKTFGCQHIVCKWRRMFIVLLFPLLGRKPTANTREPKCTKWICARIQQDHISSLTGRT